MKRGLVWKWGKELRFQSRISEPKLQRIYAFFGMICKALYLSAQAMERSVAFIKFSKGPISEKVMGYSPRWLKYFLDKPVKFSAQRWYVNL